MISTLLPFAGLFASAWAQSFVTNGVEVPYDRWTVGDLYRRDHINEFFDSEGNQNVTEEMNGYEDRGVGHDLVYEDYKNDIWVDNSPPPPNIRHKHRDNIIYDTCFKFRQLRGADFVLILDSSQSVTKKSWDIMKQFSNVLMMNARHPDSRIAVIRVADVVTVEYTFYDDPDGVVDHIPGMSQKTSSGGTLINSALQKALEMFMDPNLPVLGNARGIMLITDGIPAVSTAMRKRDAKQISENPCAPQNKLTTMTLLNINLINMLTISVGLHKNERRLTKCLWDPVVIQGQTLTSIRRFEIGLPYIEDLMPMIEDTSCYHAKADAQACSQFTTQRKCNKSWHMCRWQIRDRSARPRFDGGSSRRGVSPADVSQCIDAHVESVDCAAAERQTEKTCDRPNDDNQCTWTGTECKKNPYGALSLFTEIRQMGAQDCVANGFTFVAPGSELPEDIKELVALYSFAINSDEATCSQFQNQRQCTVFRCRNTFDENGNWASCGANVVAGCVPILPWKMKCRELSQSQMLCEKTPGCRYRDPSESDKHKIKEKNLACFGNIFPQGLGSTGNN